MYSSENDCDSSIPKALLIMVINSITVWTPMQTVWFTCLNLFSGR